MTYKKGDPRAVTSGRKGMTMRWKEKTDQNRRTRQISVYVTPEELAQITDKAERLGVSRNEYIIRAALEFT